MGCPKKTADADRCPARALTRPTATRCAVRCQACDMNVLGGSGSGTPPVSAAALFYGCSRPVATRDAREVNVSAVPLPRPVQLGRGLLVYISFGKVGSTTMRHKLEFGTYLKVLAWRKLHGASCNCDESVAHGIDVVQGKLGTCDYFGRRPCSYFTILREPVSRTISAYNYWCLGGAEGFHVRRHKETHTTHCPNISVEEWTRRHGNVYVEEFSWYRRFAATSPFSRCGADGAACVAARRPLLLDERSEEYAVARINLRQHVLVVVTEDLSTAGWRVLARAHGWDSLAWTHERLRRFETGNQNIWGPRANVTAATRRRLAALLAADVALYRDAQGLWRRYRARYAADAHDTANDTAPPLLGRAAQRAERRRAYQAKVHLMQQRKRMVARLSSEKPL